MRNLFNRQWDLIVIFILYITFIFFTITDSGESLPIFRLVLSIPVLFLFPGYILNGLFFRKKRLMFMEKLALDIVLSMCILVFGGLLFNWTGVPINKVTLLYSLVGFCCVLLLILFVVRLRYPSLPILDKKIRPAYIFIFAVVGIIVISSVSYSLWVNPQNEKFTELSVTNGIGNTDIPFTIKTNEYSFKITITNNELVDMAYIVAITYDDQAETFAVPIIVNGETWSNIINVNFDKNRSLHRLDINLFRLNSTDLYRQVHLWVMTTK